MLIFSGVDTWKAETHPTAVAASRMLGARVASADVAGIGESQVAEEAEGEQCIGGVVDSLRRRALDDQTGPARNGRASLGIGGLVDTAFSAEGVARLRFGMLGVFGNSLGLHAEPS